MIYRFLDTETTGLKPGIARVCELALVDDDGKPLLHSLINPGIPIPADATAIHGITDADVAGKPALDDLLPQLFDHCRGCVLVIYNADYDMQFVPSLRPYVREVQCAMSLAQRAMKMARWPKLSAAAEWAGHDWGQDQAHRALADARACRSVYHYARRRVGVRELMQSIR